MPFNQAELADWVNQQISPSPYHIVVTNLTTCFHDGITLCALLHSYYPDAIPFEQLSPAFKKFNIELAFTEAENVGIPPLINATDIWLTRSPDKDKIGTLMSLWKRYLEMEDESVKADLSEKCDVLKAKYNEREQRKSLYQSELQQLLDDFKDPSQFMQCKRCGDCIFLDSDKYVQMESVAYHEECHRCYNCSGPSTKSFEWYQQEIWCEKCKSLSEEQLGSGAGVGELETRLQELKQIEAVRKEKGSSPFREMELKREEERRRKMEAYKKSQLERSQNVVEDEGTEEEAAERAEREREIKARKVQELEEIRAKRQAEEDALRERIEEEKRNRANAVRAEEVNFEEIKSRRGAELEEIKAKRAGVNPFREMERQAAEARKAKFQRFAVGTKGPEAEREKPAASTHGTVRHLSKSKPVSTNPFAEMEKKRQQEKLARLKRYASIGKNVGKELLAQQNQEPEKTPAVPETTPEDKTPAQTSTPDEKDAINDLLAAVGDLPSENEIIYEPEVPANMDEFPEIYEEEHELLIQGACEELLDISQEVELLTEAAEIVQAQQKNNPRSTCCY